MKKPVTKKRITINVELNINPGVKEEDVVNFIRSQIKSDKHRWSNDWYDAGITALVKIALSNSIRYTPFDATSIIQ